MTIEEKVSEMKEIFSGAKDWEDRYKFLIEMGKDLAPLPLSLKEEEKSEKFRIKGCQSQVWLFPKFENGLIQFYGDSDALLVKGIVALLLKVYSGESPSNILNYKKDFLKELGITDHLSMNRSNGLSAMLKQIQLYALAYQTLEKNHENI